MFKNLEMLALAMGFTHLSLEFLEDCKANPGAFSRKAAQVGLSTSVGIAAKKEFFEFMAQGAKMFAPVEKKCGMCGSDLPKGFDRSCGCFDNQCQ